MRDMTFVAEISSNWVTRNGQDFSRARKLIGEAAKSGATHAKFQLFKAENLYNQKYMPDGLRNLELPEHFIGELAQVCEDSGIGFMCTPFYKQAVDIIDPFVEIHKVASWELAHEGWENPLLKHIASKGKTVFMSTAGATIPEIEHNLVYMYPDLERPPVVLLHCDPGYPVVRERADYRKLLDIATEFFPLYVGYSSHIVDPDFVAAAALLQAKVFEVHFDLNDGAGVESSHSYTPREFAQLVKMAKLFNQSMHQEDMEFGRDAVGMYRRNPEDGLRPYAR